LEVLSAGKMLLYSPELARCWNSDLDPTHSYASIDTLFSFVDKYGLLHEDFEFSFLEAKSDYFLSSDAKDMIFALLGLYPRTNDLH
jgi:hypothetical protein